MTKNTIESLKLVTRPQAADILGVAYGTLYNQAYKGTSPVPYVKIGGQVRYKLADLLECKEKNSLLAKRGRKKTTSVTGSRIPNQESFKNVLLTRREAAELLSIPWQTLASWVCRKYAYNLPVVRLKGGQVRYRLSDIIEFINTNTITPKNVTGGNKCRLGKIS
jgi:predicted site-specific integrase-resolvase